MLSSQHTISWHQEGGGTTEVSGQSLPKSSHLHSTRKEEEEDRAGVHPGEGRSGTPRLPHLDVLQSCRGCSQCWAFLLDRGQLLLS